MKPETIPMTQAIRTLKAAKADFELMTYDFELHGGTIQCATELGIDHHATIKTIILEDETRKPFVCLMHGDKILIFIKEHLLDGVAVDSKEDHILMMSFS